VGLILANFAWALPVSAGLMKSAFDAIPTELEEAAMIDGASRLRTFWSISLPLALPGIGTAGVFAFPHGTNTSLPAHWLPTAPTG